MAEGKRPVEGDANTAGASQRRPLCWWCRRNPADSGEHRWPRSLVEKLYGPGAYASAGENRPVHVSGEVERNVRSARARVLTYRDSLCTRCNNQRSQALDTALITFFRYAVDHGEALARDRRVDFSVVFGASSESSVDSLLRAFAKDLGCRFVESEMPVPRDLVALLDQRWTAHPVVDVYFDFSVELLSTFGASSSYLGKSDLVAILSSEDGTLRAASYVYTVGALGCFVGYRCRERLVNVDRVHPKKSAVYVSWGSALEEERLLKIRNIDRSLGYNDIVDVSGRHLIDGG